MTHRSDLVIQTTVTIRGIDPPIWRRLLLPTALNLAELHYILQAVFGWHDAHLHEFIIGGLANGAPEFAREGFEDEPRMFEATEVPRSSRPRASSICAAQRAASLVPLPL